MIKIIIELIIKIWWCDAKGSGRHDVHLMYALDFMIVLLMSFRFSGWRSGTGMEAHIYVLTYRSHFRVAQFLKPFWLSAQNVVLAAFSARTPLCGRFDNHSLRVSRLEERCVQSAQITNHKSQIKKCEQFVCTAPDKQLLQKNIYIYIYIYIHIYIYTYT